MNLAEQLKERSERGLSNKMRDLLNELEERADGGYSTATVEVSNYHSYVIKEWLEEEGLKITSSNSRFPDWTVYVVSWEEEG